MQLGNYFEFLRVDDIRLKGHRIEIDRVLDERKQGYALEQIIEHFSSLNLEKVYATLTYYYRHL